MRKLHACVVVSVLLGTSVAVPATAMKFQQSTSTGGKSKATSAGNVKSDSILLEHNSNIEAELSSSLNLKKAKPGEQFRMKTTQAVKREGKTLINRGATITGHLEQITRANRSTEATLVFDAITDTKTGLTTILNATITAVISTPTASSFAAARNADSVPPMTDGPDQHRPRQSNGGLVGDTVQGVGDLAGRVGSTVDSTARSTAGVNSGVNASTEMVTRGGIRIVTESGVTTSSTLSSSDKHARIEKGTRFLIRVTSDASSKN